jgi:hypothetical protein
MGRSSSLSGCGCYALKEMFHEVIFLRYGVARIVISDGGSHFIDRTFQKALSKVGVD